MKFAYSVENPGELARYAAFAEKHKESIEKYIDCISRAYVVKELPQYVVFSNFDMATRVHGDLPIPAYTNEVRVILTPEIPVWREIYLKQLEPYGGDGRAASVRDYYENALGDRAVLQILGHELAHWSEWFLDDFDEERPGSVWFEEGMAEYISRKFFLTEEEFAAEKRINQTLAALYEAHCGTDSVESFGRASYDGSYAAIFYEYWRSFLLVDALVSRYGSVEAVFAAYHRWDGEGRPCPLSEWFREN